MNSRSKHSILFYFLVLVATVSLVMSFGAPAAAAPLVDAVPECTTVAGATTWGTAASWSCGHVPLATEDVLITVPLEIVSLLVDPVNGTDTNPLVAGDIMISGTGSLRLPDQLVDLGDTTTSVTFTEPNLGGKIIQRRTVLNVDGGVDFIHLLNTNTSAEIYPGVNIDPDADVDLEVTIFGNNAACTTDVGSPNYRNRCIQITNYTADVSAVMLVYTTVSEDDVLVGFDALYQHGPAGWVWVADCGSNPGDFCLYNSGVDPALFGAPAGITNYFLVGDEVQAPTAVGLVKLAGKGGVQPFAVAGLILALGLVGGFAWKRSSKSE